LFDHIRQVFERTSLACQYVIVPIAKNLEAACRKIGIALRVGSAIVVLSAIGFDNQTELKTCKIDHPGSNGHLAAKLSGGKSTTAKQAPQRLLGLRRSLAQGFG
jgi:hypothetical protein